MGRGKVKGFIITFDAVIAVLVLFIMMISTSFYWSQAVLKAEDDKQVKALSLDFITALEKSGKIESAVTSNSTLALSSLLHKLPNRLCGEVLVYPASDLNNAALIAGRKECSVKDEVFSAKRSIIVTQGNDVNFSLATLNLWRRGQ